MLKNNLKVTIAILKRKKIFSAITILGIAVPLMFLMIIISTISHIASFESPQTNFGRVILFDNLTFSIERKNSMSGNIWGNPTYDFVRKYIRPMKSPEKVGVVTDWNMYNIYLNDEKSKLVVVYTDDAFWNIADFNFTEGKAYNSTDVENSQLVAVIDEYTKKLVFGDESAIGESIKFFRKNYKIIGVVKNVDITRRRTYANVYLPITTSEEYSKKDIFGSGCTCLMLAESKERFPQIKAEFKYIIDNFQLGNYEGLTKIEGELESDTFNKIFQGLFREIFSIKIEEDKIIYFTYAIIFFFFILLPSVNLLYIHISRINERSSEIGVRKSFGGNRSILSRQFIFENLFITIFSGVIGFIFTLLFLIIMNTSNIIPGLHLSLNFNGILLILTLWILFGLITGYLPALRMSRMKIIDALHQHDSFQYFDFMIWKAKRLKILLVVEFALTFIALAAIFTFIFQFQKNSGHPLGFDYNDVYKVWVTQYDKQSYSFYGEEFPQDILELIKSAGLTESYGDFKWNEPYHEGYTRIDDQLTYNENVAENVHLTGTGLNIDKILKLNVIAGRWFDKSDDRPDYYPVVINQSLKKRLFKDEMAIGKHILLGENHLDVIGIIDHYKYQGEFSKPVDILFFMNQFSNIRINGSISDQSDFLRVKSGTSVGEINNLARIISQKFPDYEIEITPLKEERTRYIRKIWGPLVAVIVVFSFVLLIVLLGLFGVLWYNISIRKTEMGLRRAVGANKQRIFTQVIREMLWWASVGIIIGAVIFVQIPLLNLYSIEMQVILTSIISAGGIIYILVTLCSLFPGIQASKIHPAAALHEE